VERRADALVTLYLGKRVDKGVRVVDEVGVQPRNAEAGGGVGAELDDRHRALRRGIADGVDELLSGGDTVAVGVVRAGDTDVAVFGRRIGELHAARAVEEEGEGVVGERSNLLAAGVLAIGVAAVL